MYEDQSGEFLHAFGYCVLKGPTENRLGELGSLYKYYYYYYYYY